MPYVVTEPCINCKYTDCVEVFPVEAIYADDLLADEWAHYAVWNAYLAEQWRALGCNITEKKEPLPDADYWTTAEKNEEDIRTWDDGS